MENKNSYQQTEVLERLQDLIATLLEEGFGAADISFGLAAASTHLGLDLAPDPQIALAVVIDGVKTACAARSESVCNETQGEDPQLVVPVDVTFH